MIERVSILLFGANLEILCGLLPRDSANILQAHLAGGMPKLETQLVVIFMESNMTTSTRPAFAVLGFYTSSCFPVCCSCIPQL